MTAPDTNEAPVADPVVEDPAVVGAIAATPEPAAPLPPIPFDPAASHPIDSHALDTVITKTTTDGYAVDFGNGSSSDGNAIADGDALTHLPVGAKLVVGVEGPTKIALSIPPTDTEGAYVSFGTSVHEAIAKLWGTLVKFGHAVVTDVEKL